MTLPPLTLLARLDGQDRALLQRWVIDAVSPQWRTTLWRTITQAGGAWSTILLTLGTTLLPFTAPVQRAGRMAAVTLLVSHLVVQIVKRRVMRTRPTATLATPHHIPVPDCFSFPSGHSCAAMSVALPFAFTFPAAASPVLISAAIVGFSRVRLGVHYVGDVLAGQLIAITSFGLLAALR
jgi:undecaprenyl-diphosphatase